MITIYMRIFMGHDRLNASNAWNLLYPAVKNIRLYGRRARLLKLEKKYLCIDYKFTYEMRKYSRKIRSAKLPTKSQSSFMHFQGQRNCPIEGSASRRSAPSSKFPIPFPQSSRSTLPSIYIQRYRSKTSTSFAPRLASHRCGLCTARKLHSL